MISPFPANLSNTPTGFSIPAFEPIDGGVPGNTSQIGATIFDSTETALDFNALGNPNPTFSLAGSMVVPPLSVVNLFSAGAAVPLAPSPGASWELYKPDTEITPGSFVISIDPLKVSAGQLNARAKLSSTLLITSSQVSGKTVSIPVNFTSDPLPWFTNTGFAHSASYALRKWLASPGMPFLIGGGNFGPATLAGLALNPDGSAFRRRLADTSGAVRRKGRTLS